MELREVTVAYMGLRAARYELEARPPMMPLQTLSAAHTIVSIGVSSVNSGAIV
jgi:hypothetical protein